MKRTELTRIALSGLIFLLLPQLACENGSRDIKELKFAFFAPPSHKQYPVIEEWSKNISEKAGVDITIFSGGSLGKPKDQYDNTSKGVSDFAYVIPSYTSGKFPLTSAIELPFIIDDCVEASEVLWDTYEKYLTEEYKEVKVLWTYVPEPGHIHTTEKPVRTLKDLEGLKIRTPGREMARSLKKLGAVPVTMPITQVYTALERGTIDGVTMAWEILESYKLYEHIKFHTEVGLYTLAMLTVMNRDAYDSLSPESKRILDQSIGLEMSRKAAVAFREAEISARKTSLSHGGEVVPFPPSERQKWVEAVKGVRSEWIQEMTDLGLPGKEVLEYIETALQ